jgi:hypothetical protein
VIGENGTTAPVARRRHIRRRSPPAHPGAPAPLPRFKNAICPNVINWDSIACDSRDFLVMGDPLKTYNEEVEKFLSTARPLPQSDK